MNKFLAMYYQTGDIFDHSLSQLTGNFSRNILYWAMEHDVIGVCHPFGETEPNFFYRKYTGG